VGARDATAWHGVLTLERTSPWRFTWRVAARSDGTLDVVRGVETKPQPSSPPSLALPFVATLRDAVSAVRGVVLLEGERSTVDLDLPGTPEKLTLDPDGALFGRFFDVSASDKGTLVRRGYQTLARDPAAAESIFRQALALPPDSGRGGSDDADVRLAAAPVLDVTAALELARAALDRGADDEARGRIDQAREALGRVHAFYRAELETDLAVIESRLALRGDGARAVARRLTKLWDDGALTNAEGLLLLAVAARRLGDEDLAQDAIEIAQRRRAEVTDLGPLLSARVPLRAGVGRLVR